MRPPFPTQASRGPERGRPRHDAPGTLPSGGCATLCLRDSWGAAVEVPFPYCLPGVSLPCVETSGAWGRGRGGGEGSGVTRLLLPPPPPSGASFLQRGRPVTPALLQAGRGRATDQPGQRWGGGCFLITQVLAFRTADLWSMGW